MQAMVHGWRQQRDKNTLVFNILLWYHATVGNTWSTTIYFGWFSAPYENGNDVRSVCSIMSTTSNASSSLERWFGTYSCCNPESRCYKMLTNRGLNKVPSILAQELSFYDVGVSFNGGTPQNTLKWLFLVGKPTVVRYHHFGKPPCYFLFQRFGKWTEKTHRLVRLEGTLRPKMRQCNEDASSSRQRCEDLQEAWHQSLSGKKYGQRVWQHTLFIQIYLFF